MPKLSVIVLTASLTTVVMAADSTQAVRTGKTSTAKAPTPHAAALSAEEQNKVVGTVCSTCHDDEMKPAGLSLASFDAVTVSAETAEKMIRKLRAGMMPPPSFKDGRPSNETLQAFATALENK